MRIAIDGRFISHPQMGGFKVYTENLVRNLARLGAEHTYLVYLDRPRPDLGALSAPNVELRIVPGTFPYLGMPWREQVRLPLRARRQGAELLHFPCLTGALASPCPTAVTIFDIIWATRIAPEWWQSPKRLALALHMRYVPALMIRRARAVITISQAARRDLVERLGVPAGKVHVTPVAANPAHRRLDDPAALAALRHKYRLGSEFILGLGSADPRKNIDGLIRAYARLGDDLKGRYELVVAWCHDYLEDGLRRLIRELGLGERVRFIDDVPDPELTALYNAASLFVFPSRYEGFGFPPLEAMACGTPVVAGDNSSFPEVLGDAALLVNVGGDAAPLAGAMARVLSDEGLRATLVARGCERVRRYSWERCAAATLAVYAEVVAEAKGAGR